jgi:hypothetical protein
MYRRRSLPRNFLVCLTLSVTPLGMADDHQLRASVDQHRRRRAARVCASFGEMDVLGSDRETGDCPSRPIDKRGGNAKPGLDRGEARSRGRDRPDLGNVGPQPVHFPVPDYQLSARHRSSLVFQPSAA